MTHHNPERPGPPPSADEGAVLYEKRDRIAYVTINRPEARNAIDPDVHRLMIETWADFRDDDSVDVAILTGEGEAFCAGADLKTYIPPFFVNPTPRVLRETADHHGSFEAVAPAHDWWDWYAAYMDARERGSSQEEAAAAAGRYMADVKQVVVSHA